MRSGGEPTPRFGGRRGSPPIDTLQTQLLHRVGLRGLYVEVPSVYEVRVLTATVASGWAAVMLEVVPRRGLAPSPPGPWSAGSPLERVRFPAGWMNAPAWSLCTDPELLRLTREHAVVASAREWSAERCGEVLAFLRSCVRSRIHTAYPHDLD